MTLKESMPPELRAAFEEIENLPDCRVSICARSLEGPLAGTQFGVGEDLIFLSASLIKLLVLMELLRQVDNGIVSLDEEILVADVVEDSEMVEAEELPARFSVGRLVEGMICLSDNTATNLLISRCGMERIDAHARELGLRHTTLRRRMMDFAACARGKDNSTSASDMVALLAGLWDGRSLSEHSRDFALKALLDQRLTSGISLYPPPGARFAHKTGELDGIEHDAGLMIVPDSSFAIAVLSQGEISTANSAVESTTRLLYEAMKR